MIEEAWMQSVILLTRKLLYQVFQSIQLRIRM